MDEFCKSFQTDLNLSPTCLSWYRQATKHCMNVLLRKRDLGVCFWSSIKNFIFPERQTGLITEKISIAVHPNHLTLRDCHSLLLDVVNDYVLRAPRFSIETTMNILLWKIVYSLMGLMTLGSLLLGTVFTYRKFRKTFKKYDPLREIFAPEKRICAYINRNLRIIKYELHRLHLLHIIQPEELFQSDGSLTMVIKLSSKLNFVDGIVSGNVQAGARLYRLHQFLGRKKPDYKLETVPKVMKFINNCSRKLRMLFIFDEDHIYEDLPNVKDFKNHNKNMQSKLASPVIPSAVGNTLSPTNTICSNASKFIQQRSLNTQIPRNYVRCSQTPRNRSIKSAL